MNNLKVTSKKGQLKLSFGMIFSIILIIIFLVFAGYAIKKVLDIQKSAKIGLFADGLQADIDKIWNDEYGTQTREYSLSKNIESVCFEKAKQRIYFEPAGVGGEFDYWEFEHVRTFDGFCVDNINNKIKLIIKKDFGEALVTIESAE